MKVKMQMQLVAALAAALTALTIAGEPALSKALLVTISATGLGVLLLIAGVAIARIDEDMSVPFIALGAPLFLSGLGFASALVVTALALWAGVPLNVFSGMAQVVLSAIVAIIALEIIIKR